MWIQGDVQRTEMNQMKARLSRLSKKTSTDSDKTLRDCNNNKNGRLSRNGKCDSNKNGTIFTKTIDTKVSHIKY